MVNPPVLAVLQVLPHSPVCEGWKVVNYGFKARCIPWADTQPVQMQPLPQVRPFLLRVSPVTYVMALFLHPKSEVCILNRQRWGCRQGNRGQIDLGERSAVPCAHPGAWHFIPIFPERKKASKKEQACGKRAKIQRQAVSRPRWEACPGPMLWEAKLTSGMHSPKGRRGFAQVQENDLVPNTHVSNQFMKLFKIFKFFF